MPKIKIFSTHTCVYCFMLKNYLRQKGVAFEDIYIDEDPKAAQESIDTCDSMAVPCTHITLDNGEEIKILGFDKPRFDQILGLN